MKRSWIIWVIPLHEDFSKSEQRTTRRIKLVQAGFKVTVLDARNHHVPKAMLRSKRLCCVEDWVAVMESRDFVSVSRPIFASVGLESFRSRSQASCFETLNTAAIRLGKISVIQHFFSAISAAKKQPKEAGNMPEICKFSPSKLWKTFFWKFFGKFSAYSTNSQVSILDFLMKSWSQSFDQVSVSKFRSRLHLCYVATLRREVL